MIKQELTMEDEGLKWMGKDELGENDQYGETLNLVLEESKLRLVNDKVSNRKKLLVILSGLMLALSSGATLAYGESLLGVIGSVLAVTVIEIGLLL